MPHHSQVVIVTAQATYPAAAQVDLRDAFVPHEWLVLNTSAAATCWVSFDGVNDHIPMTPGKPNEGISRLSKCQRLWVRRETAGIDVATVEVMASTV